MRCFLLFHSGMLGMGAWLGHFFLPFGKGVNGGRGAIMKFMIA